MNAPVITTNHGIAGVRDRAAGGRGELDVTKHVDRMRVGSDGYIDMTAYNESAPWSNATRVAAGAFAQELVAGKAVGN